MADFDAVKISFLPPTNVVSKDDLLVIDKLQTDTKYLTSKGTVGILANFFAASDLNFTGEVTFVGTIQAPPSLSLNAVFDDVTINNSLILGDGVQINGLSLDDLEDVEINNPKVGETLVYSGGLFRNDQISSDLLRDANADGRVYARKNKEWYDITDCIQCPGVGGPGIGSVEITPQSSTIDLSVNDTVNFVGSVTGLATDLRFAWKVVPNSVVLVNGPFESKFAFDLTQVITYIITNVLKYINDYQITSRLNYETLYDDGVKVNVGSTDISLNDISQVVDYSWSINTNQAKIIIRGEQEAIIDITQLINHVLRCVESDGFITTEEGMYSASVYDGELTITKSYTDGGNVEINTDVDSTLPVNYDWNVSPVTYNIKSLTTDEVSITFLEPINYVVNCTVTSPTAGDSPQTGVYPLSLSDIYTLSADPQGEDLLDESGFNLLYDY